MAKLIGQLDGLDYPKNVPSLVNNIKGPVGSGVSMKGQMKINKSNVNQMPNMGKPKVGMKGQNS